MMIFSRIFTAAGAALILTGIFLPFLAVPIFHDDTFYELTQQGAWIAIGLAVISLGCVAFRRFGLLYFTGLATVTLVIYTMYEVNTRKAGYLTDFQKALEGSPLKGLGVSFVKSVDFTHGAAFMLAGALILICVPLLGSRISLRRNSGRTP